MKEVQGRFLVGIVGADNKVSIKEVKAGQQYGQLWVIDDGLKPGEKVIAEGIQKVKDGMTVVTKPFVMPPETGDTGQKGSAQPKAENKPDAAPSTQPDPDKVGSHG